MWAQRMANLTGEASYAGVLERALYNGVLSGASADGTHYLYRNPLTSAGDVRRHEWFGVACCPPNLARLLSSLQNYAYAQNSDELAVHLYVAGQVRTTAGGGAALQVTTRYPVNGEVTISVLSAAKTMKRSGPWTLALRLPA